LLKVIVEFALGLIHASVQFGLYCTKIHRSLDFVIVAVEQKFSKISCGVCCLLRWAAIGDRINRSLEEESLRQR
jgi:hypothetical protein